MRTAHGLIATILVSSASLLFASEARGQQQTIIIPSQPAPAPAATRTEAAEEYAGPSRALLFSGVVTLGVPYAASAIVAAESDHQGDKRLYVPILGPWLDLGDRGDCNVRSSSCDNETTNKVLLVGDGVLQSLGVLQIVGAFVFPEKRIATTHVAATKYTPELTITPARIGRGGFGLSAVGRF